MKKIILFLAATITIAGCVITHTDLTKDTKFKEIISKTYQTADDFVLTQSQDSKEIWLDEFDEQGVPARKEIKDKFPYQYESKTIHGVLPKGSLFKVIKVTYMQSFETSHIYYYAEIISNGKFKGETFGVSFLTDGSEVPKFLNKYAVEVNQ